MKNNLCVKILLFIILIFIVICAVVSCESGKDDETGTTPPDTLDSTDLTDQQTTEGGDDIVVPVEKSSFVEYNAAGTPDYSKYLNGENIKNALSGTDTVAVALNGVKAWYNGTYASLDKNAVTRKDGKLGLDGEVMTKLTGKTVTGSDSASVASSLGMNFYEYENKMTVFYTGNKAPLDAFNDYYTLEALYLELTDAPEEDRVNAFIDLPKLISNGQNSATYYTDPNMSLAVQTNIYRAELGDNPAVEVGPAIVAGEGRSELNHTLVRVLNNQQICTAQFLAYDASVTGGVQVAAAKLTDNSVLIATAAFDASQDCAKSINVFNVNGTKRFVITPDEAVSAPYRITTGYFYTDRPEEVLLVTGSAPDADGKLNIITYSLSEGVLLHKFSLDCGFAGQSEVQLSVRVGSGDKADSLIVYFPGVNFVYEGDVASMKFDWAGIQLPANADGVYASSNPGEKYIVTLKETDDTKDQSFVRIYNDADAEWGKALDVGFKENVFYSSMAADNDTAYVDNCSFQHIRADISNNGRAILNNLSDKQKFDDKLLELGYSDFAFSGVGGYQSTYKSKNVLLEPCFTHRWNGGTFNNFVDYVDENGDHIYAALGKSGEYEKYIELGSGFDNGTYADGILVLAKIRIYPIRTFTRALAETYRGKNGDPFNLIGISPVHEQEINVDGSVGDYNVKMVEGFRNFLLTTYGSVEKVNERFGTSFALASDIDAPRAKNRGDWDNYSSDYGKQWTMYSRNMINKRILEAYREALLAGFPPETISSHQIPEGDAVSGLLGQADTRLSPVDVVMSSGTAFGATRYGVFHGDKYNFLKIAHNAGHNAIEFGEYSSANESDKTAYKQLDYIWKNGVRVTHIIAFNDRQYQAEQYAIDMLAERNEPRPGYTGGTSGVIGVSQGDKTYNVIQIGQGTGDDTEGLLKSVNSDGSFEGTVYVVPFHSQVDVKKLSFTDNGGVFESEKISGLQNGDQVEIKLPLRYAGEGKAKVRFSVYDYSDANVEFEVGSELCEYRFVLSNQISPDDLTIGISFEADDRSKLEIGDIDATMQTECVGRKYFQGNKGALEASKPHVGGVTFDLIDRDRKN